MVLTFVIATLVGLAVGVLSGLLGVGGGTVLVPVFRLAFGMSALGATATSLFTIIPTSLSGAFTHIRAKTCIPKLGLALGLGGACTSMLGVWLAQWSPAWLVMSAAALIIGYSAFTMLQKALKLPRGKREDEPDSTASNSAAASVSTPASIPAAALASAPTPASTLASAPTPTPAPAPATAPEPPAPMTAPEPPAPMVAPEPPAPATAPEPPALSTADIVKAALIGAVAGVASGYVGLGGGFIMVPLMVSVMGLPMRLVSGTSLIAVMILATPATVLQCVLGNVDYLAGIAVACGTIPGAMLGARLVTRIPERALRLAFAAFLGVAAILLVVKELGLLG